MATIDIGTEIEKQMIPLPDESPVTPKKKLQVIIPKPKIEDLNDPNKTLAPIRDYAPVYVRTRLKRKGAKIQDCAACAFCAQAKSFKGSKRYTELSAQLAIENYNDDMVKFHKFAADSYAALAKEIAAINKRHEQNMLFPEQNKLVYVEIEPCPIHADVY